jgi:hypothetical protein
MLPNKNGYKQACKFLVVKKLNRWHTVKMITQSAYGDRINTVCEEEIW